jgi:hypothetical protein
VLLAFAPQELAAAQPQRTQRSHPPPGAATLQPSGPSELENGMDVLAPMFPSGVALRFWPVSGGRTTSGRSSAAKLSRSMVGSGGTRQPTARRSQARRRACPAHDAGVHLRPRLAGWRPANSLSAVRVRGRRAVVKDVGVRPPNDGQAAADHARPRRPQDTTPAAVHVVRVEIPSASCTLRAPICRHFTVAVAVGASRARPCSASLQP